MSPRTKACTECGIVYWLAAGHACATTGPVCPGHGTPLSGGPINWHCHTATKAHPLGHGVTAADLVAAWELAA